MRTGIVEASAACNVPLSRENNRDYELIREKRNTEKTRAKAYLQSLPADTTKILKELERPASKNSYKNSE